MIILLEIITNQNIYHRLAPIMYYTVTSYSEVIKVISKVLSDQQVKAVKNIPRIGMINFRTAGIAPNTINSLVKLGIINRDQDYVNRII